MMKSDDERLEALGAQLVEIRAAVSARTARRHQRAIAAIAEIADTAASPAAAGAVELYRAERDRRVGVRPLLTPRKPRKVRPKPRH